MSWCTELREQTAMAKSAIQFVQNAVERNILLGAICDATTFLGANGWLNNCKHTSNTLEDLKLVSKEKYRGSENYILKQAVSDKNIITANGTGYLEFTKEVLYALEAYPKKDIDIYYDFYKKGYYEALKIHGVAKGI